MRTLRRRALLALPVALPVAAVAAKAEAMTTPSPHDAMVEAVRKQMQQMMRVIDEQSARIRRLLDVLDGLHRKYPTDAELAATLGIAEVA